jgi:hypothetical protein
MQKGGNPRDSTRSVAVWIFKATASYRDQCGHVFGMTYRVEGMSSIITVRIREISYCDTSESEDRSAWADVLCSRVGTQKDMRERSVGNETEGLGPKEKILSGRRSKGGPAKKSLHEIGKN